MLDLLLQFFPQQHPNHVPISYEASHSYKYIGSTVGTLLSVTLWSSAGGCNTRRQFANSTLVGVRSGWLD